VNLDIAAFAEFAEHITIPSKDQGQVPLMMPKEKPRRERDVQRAILALNGKIPGLTLFKTGAGSFRVNGRFVRMGHKGVSDLVGYWTRPLHTMMGQPRLTAIFVSVEVKQRGKKPTPEQAAFLERVKQAGGIAVVARCVEDVLGALK
jgi:hypothetical protein